MQANDANAQAAKWSGIIPGTLLILENNQPLADESSTSATLNALVEDSFATLIRVAQGIHPDHVAEQRGIVCVSCEYDGPTPPPGVVTAFFYTLRTAKGGRVAMQSDGRGRAETLCALHLMHAHGFSADEALVWVLLVCPGAKLTQKQAEYVRGVGAGLEAAAGTGAGRDEALRRGVFGMWAAEQQRFYRRFRPESPYHTTCSDERPGVIAWLCASGAIGQLTAACLWAATSFLAAGTCAGEPSFLGLAGAPWAARLGKPTRRSNARCYRRRCE